MTEYILEHCAQIKLIKKKENGQTIMFRMGVGVSGLDWFCIGHGDLPFRYSSRRVSPPKAMTTLWGTQECGSPLLSSHKMRYSTSPSGLSLEVVEFSCPSFQVQSVLLSHQEQCRVSFGQCEP